MAARPYELSTGAGPTLVVRDPLSNIDSEEYVLAAMLADPSAVAAARGIVAAADFAVEGHQRIFAAMAALAERGDPVDYVSLLNELEARGYLPNATVDAVVDSLGNLSVFAANLPYHARVVRDLAQRRDMRDALGRLGNELATTTAAPHETLAGWSATFATLADRARPGDADDETGRATCALNAPPAEPIGWLAVDFWTRGDIGVIAGEGGSFKSTTALHLACAVAGGYAAFNRFPTERRPVLILSAEDGPDVVQMKIEAMCAGQGWDRERVLSNVHYRATDAASLTDPRWQAWLRSEARRLGVGLLVLDPWAELITGNESDNSEQRATVKFLRSLTRESGAAIAIVAHATKPTADARRVLDRIRGASALRDAARVVHFCERSDDGIITIRNPKLSRATTLPSFVIEAAIEHEPHNRAAWTSARLTLKTVSAQKESLAEAFVLAQLERSPGLGSTELRKAATGTGVSAAEVAEALNSLEANGRIEYEAGPRGAKHWRVRPCQTLRQGDAFDPADPANTLPGRVARLHPDPAPPLGGRQGQDADSGAGQAA